MPPTPEPVDRRPVWERETPTKFERIFGYSVISIVVILGVLVLAGTFGINPQFRGVLGIILIGYGLIRVLLMKTRHERFKEGAKERLTEDKKGANKNLGS